MYSVKAKRITSTRKLRERGSTLLLFTFLTVLLLVPMIGLAIDGSVVYWEKARLSASVDSAALAAGRSLSSGSTLSAQIANATAMAQTYFAANFQPGTMGTAVVGGQPTVNIVQTATTVRVVTVQATITVPLYFLRILGFSTATLTDTGQAQRRDVNVVVVLDRSGSMSGPVCATMVASAQSFVNMFVDGRDEVGLITFQTTANLDYASTLYFQSSNPSLNSVLGTLVCAGGTNSSMALTLAYNQIKTINRPGALNVILFYTDGYPTAFNITAGQIKTKSDVRYDSVNTGTLDNPSAASTCSAGDVLSGVLIDHLEDDTTTGYTYGVTNPAGIPITSSGGANPPLISAPGCNFTTHNNMEYMRADLAYIPATDSYGNTTDTGYMPLLYFPSSDPNYANMIRPDSPQSILGVSYNTADYVAKLARNDPTYQIIIYTIGLGSNGGVNADFLERLANDPRASSYDSTKPAGEFVYSPTPSELSAAFQQIASEVLRLSM